MKHRDAKFQKDCNKRVDSQGPGYCLVLNLLKLFLVIQLPSIGFAQYSVAPSQEVGATSVWTVALKGDPEKPDEIFRPRRSNKLQKALARAHDFLFLEQFGIYLVVSRHSLDWDLQGDSSVQFVEKLDLVQSKLQVEENTAFRHILSHRSLSQSQTSIEYSSRPEQTQAPENRESRLESSLPTEGNSADDNSLGLESIGFVGTQSPSVASMYKQYPAGLLAHDPQLSKIRIGLLDSGVDRRHPYLQGARIFQEDFLYSAKSATPYRDIRISSLGGESLNVSDQVGHGTAIASILVGRPDLISKRQGQMISIASGATLLSGRICDGSLYCRPDAILSGLNWLARQKVDVINLSLSVPQLSKATIKALEILVRRNTLVVTSSGNYHDAKETSLQFPAQLTSVISVGSVKTDGSERSSFSRFGPQLTLVAPGEEILAAVPEGLFMKSRVAIKVPKGFVQEIDSRWDPRSSLVIYPETDFLVAWGDKRNNRLIQGPQGQAGVRQALLVARVDANQDVWDVSQARLLSSSLVLSYLPLLSANEFEFGGGVAKPSSFPFPIPFVQLTLEGALQIQKALLNNSFQGLRVSLLPTAENYWRGTSFSAPLVAGGVARMKSLDPSLTPARVREILELSSNRVPGAKRDEVGFGVFNLARALRILTEDQ